MGDMNKFEQLTDGVSDRPFADFKAHSDSHRVDTNLTILESLRKHYPKFRIDCISTFQCDFLGYAKAGHATATHKEDGGSFKKKTYYVAPSGRKSGHIGKLGSSIMFGKFEYTCDNYTFIVYKVEYETDRCGTQHEYFVLSPKSDGNTEDEHSSEIDTILIKIGNWTSELHDEVYVFDNGHWSKSNNLWKSIKDATWSDVILDERTKKGIIDDIESFFDRRDLYEELGVPWKRGIIFHGLPGNGKTISIKALMGSLAARSDSIPSLYVKSLDCQSGEQYAIRMIFSLARTMGPCLLIFEDLDSLVTDKVRSYFLNEVDGLESNDGILIIGSTNHLDKLDASISKRPSRFDRKYHFNLPNEEERLAYCEFWRRKLQKSHIIEFSEDISPVVAKLTEGFSFAYLKELFIMALLIIAHGADLGDDDDNIEEVKAKAPTTKEPGKVSEPKVDETDAVVVEAPKEGPDGSKGENTDKSELLEKLKGQSEVVIPEHLKDNLLLKVLRRQSRVLLLEMDNTDVEKWKSGRLGYDSQKTSKTMMPMRMGRALPVPMW
jgi:transitional endoplasmic reticulum ATPase